MGIMDIHILCIIIEGDPMRIPSVFIRFGFYMGW